MLKGLWHSWNGCGCGCKDRREAACATQACRSDSSKRMEPSHALIPFVWVPPKTRVGLHCVAERVEADCGAVASGGVGL